jgi:hypothetical protein
MSVAGHTGHTGHTGQTGHTVPEEGKSDHITIVDALLRGNVLVLQAFLESTLTNSDLNPRRATIQITRAKPHVYVHMPSSVDMHKWQDAANRTLQSLMTNITGTQTPTAPVHRVAASTATLVVGRYHHDQHDNEQRVSKTMHKVYLSDIAFYSSRILTSLDTFASSQGGRLYHTDWPVTLSLLCDLGCPVGFRSAAAVFGTFTPPDVGDGASTCTCDYENLRHVLDALGASGRHIPTPSLAREVTHLVAAPSLCGDSSRGPNIWWPAAC